MPSFKNESRTFNLHDKMKGDLLFCEDAPSAPSASSTSKASAASPLYCRTVLDLIHNRRKITVEMALRLSKFFGSSYKFWLNLQNELETREIRKKIEKDLNQVHLYSHTVS
ncbi:MAG: HigA family addiction module antitoxin [Rectinema subterraneum]